MKSLLKNSILVLSGVLILNSCQKATPLAQLPLLPTFPITVHATSVTPKYNMRMFVGNVEIKDTAKISKFFSTVPYKYTAASILTNFPQSYTFTAADSLQVSTLSRVVFTPANNKYVVGTTLHYNSTPGISLINLDQFSMYPSVIAPISTGGYNVSSYFVAYGDYTDFSLSILNFKYHSNSHQTTTMALTSNEFNIASLNSLGLTDTLAVQEFSLHYKSNLN